MKCRTRTTALNVSCTTLLIALALPNSESVMTLARAQTVRPQLPLFLKFAPTPAVGWNNYDTFGDTVTEPEVMTNAQYVKKEFPGSLMELHCYRFRWYDTDLPGNDFLLNELRTGAKLPADRFRRLLSVVNRSPSSANGEMIP